MLITEAYLRLAFDTKRITQLTDDSNDSGIPGGIITQIIAAADDFVKATLSKQYTTAAMEASPLCQRLCAVIALYMLESRKGNVTDGVQAQYEQATATLAGIVDGTIKLTAEEQVLPRISPTACTDIFEVSNYFTGMLKPGESL